MSGKSPPTASVSTARGLVIGRVFSGLTSAEEEGRAGDPTANGVIVPGDLKGGIVVPTGGVPNCCLNCRKSGV